LSEARLAPLLVILRPHVDPGPLDEPEVLDHGVVALVDLRDLFMLGRTETTGCRWRKPAGLALKSAIPPRQQVFPTFPQFPLGWSSWVGYNPVMNRPRKEEPFRVAYLLVGQKLAA